MHLKVQNYAGVESFYLLDGLCIGLELEPIVAIPPAIWPHARRDLGIVAHVGPIHITK